MSYPDMPGYSGFGPSKDAAHAVRGPARELRKRVVAFLRAQYPRAFAAHEIAEHFEMQVYPIRPRLSEAYLSHEIEPTGEQRLSPAGRRVNCWRAIMSSRVDGGDHG